MKKGPERELQPFFVKGQLVLALLVLSLVGWESRDDDVLEGKFV